MKNEESPKKKYEVSATLLIGAGIILLGYAIVVILSNDRHVMRPLEFFVSPN